MLITSTTVPQTSSNKHTAGSGATLDIEDIVDTINLGSYARPHVAYLTDEARPFFDAGYRLLLAYQHELADHCFRACLEVCPDVALAHGLIAICHAPNYNFRGESYYAGTFQEEEINLPDEECGFPSQHVADQHSAMGVALVEQRSKKSSDKSMKRRATKKKKHNDDAAVESPDREVLAIEDQMLGAIRLLTGNPGVHATLSDEVAGRPYADAMRKAYLKYPTDPDIAYFFCESLMVLNAWNLYEYPSGRALSPDVDEIQSILHSALVDHPRHPGLCHMYVHLSEMSPQPNLGMSCVSLRTDMPDAGHLIHMPSHIDVLLGDYEACVRGNEEAIEADRRMMELSPTTAGVESFYFGYIVHDYHMAVYGALLGGMEAKAASISNELQKLIPETLFREHPECVGYLEAYATLDIAVLVRFGRWSEIMQLPFPNDRKLMLSRTAELLFARALSMAITGEVDGASREADRYDSFVAENIEEAKNRILHNNPVASLLAVNATMMRGELWYRQGNHTRGFALLRQAVTLQDELNYDEPWGKMQPIRHALGGLLAEQDEFDEAIAVFREDLSLHPGNPWALVGLIRALKEQNTCDTAELTILEDQLRQHRLKEWVDFDVAVACECCQKAK